MTKEDFHITVISCEEGGYCAFPSNIPGLIVQTEKISEIPKELAKSFEAIMSYALTINNYSIQDIDLEGV